MGKFLTLVVSSGIGNVLTGQLEELISSFHDNHSPVSHIHWLSHNTACDLRFDAGDDQRIEEHARKFFIGKPVDLLSGDVDDRRKKLLIADMDSTIVTSETLDDMAAYAGLKEKIAAITERGLRGELDFEDSIRTRVAMIAGLPASAINETLKQVELSPDARSLVQTMRKNGAYTALVSGGFTLFTEPVGDWCGFHETHGNTIELADGKLTGKVMGGILGREAKLQALDTLASRHGISRADALAIGDGANDLDMISAAGLGIAYYGKPLLANAARGRIEHTTLKTALYFQGFEDTEILDT